VFAAGSKSRTIPARNMLLGHVYDSTDYFRGTALSTCWTAKATQVTESCLSRLRNWLGDMVQLVAVATKPTVSPAVVSWRDSFLTLVV
jgi:hypothetical protein